MSDIPKDHPRYVSLITRERIVEGVDIGITSQQGLVAQGRGECFDYLIGERTTDSALMAEKVAVCMLLLAKHPVMSVNGNVAALVPELFIELSNLLFIPIEVNLFHRTDERVQCIIEHLEQNGASNVLGGKGDAKLSLGHGRAVVDSDGIYGADVVLVPLEDGDRCQKLVEMGKAVITIDLNPMSRTSRTATISIVDNVVRALDNMVAFASELKSLDESELQDIVKDYSNYKILADAVREIKGRLDDVIVEL